MTHWIVNPRTHEVRLFNETEPTLMNGLLPQEFIFMAPTAADAAMAGRRHNLAVEALESLPESRQAWTHAAFVLLGDRINAQSENTADAHEQIADLAEQLEEVGFEVWREGLALVVLARRAPVAEDSGSAWVSEIGSDR